MTRSVLAAGAAIIVAACLAPDEPIPETRITRMQAFNCAVANASVCNGRGDPIPLGQLPPKNTVFMVWAWHPGFNTTAWRLFWLDQVSDPALQMVGEDSVGVSLSLDQPDSIKTIGIRAYILGNVNGQTVPIYKDSITWVFP